VVANVRQRLSVNKRAARKFETERFNLKKLNDVAFKEQYQVKISNSFAVLENLVVVVVVVVMMWTSIGLRVVLQEI
jgi:hypothetical protein